MENILHIEAYSNENYTGSPKAVFKVTLPPEKITTVYTLKYDQDQPNTTGKKAAFKGYENAKMNFNFVLDGTGATGIELGHTDVPAAVKALSELVYEPQSNEHRPNYIGIKYGDIIFKCNLDSITVDYVLFDSNCKPLRAKITMALSERALPKKTKDRKFASPDMTHIKYFSISDNIFSFSKEIYEDFTHYIQIAQLNQVLNFRDIKPGSSLIFPPFEKI